MPKSRPSSMTGKPSSSRLAKSPVEVVVPAATALLQAKPQSIPKTRAQILFA
jgi:hypothetical protein